MYSTEHSFVVKSVAKFKKKGQEGVSNRLTKQTQFGGVTFGLYK